jgi:flagellar motor switch protein FliG
MTDASPLRRRAAVVLSQLEASAAEELISRLPPPQAEELRAQVVSLANIDAAERQAAMEAFLSASPLDELRTRLAAARRTAAHTPQSLAASQPFAFLQQTGAEALARSLAEEPPAVAAQVVRHLPAARAGAVLARLAPAAQAEVLACLVQQRRPDELPVDELEERLRAKLDSTGEGSSGIEALAEILRACRPHEQQLLRQNLARHAPKVAGLLASIPHEGPSEPAATFDDVLRLSDDRLSRLFYEADPDVAILALAGGPASLVERVCEQLPAREARLMQRAVENLGPVRLGDIDAARQAMAHLATRFIRAASLDDTPQRHLAVMI